MENDCNCCGRWAWCEMAWPAPNGCYYAYLCSLCRKLLYEPEQWERERLELVPNHSE